MPDGSDQAMPEAVASSPATAAALTPPQTPTTHGRPPAARVWSWLYPLSVAGLVVVGAASRLYHLGVTVERGFDEGVYWATLRAMASGHALYGQVFLSQPPFFMLSDYPFYLLGGQSLWSARLGIALVSMLAGFTGAFLLGHKLAGRVGALVALALFIVNTDILTWSRTIEALPGFVAFELLAVGCAYAWLDAAAPRRADAYAAAVGVAIALATLTKLFGIAALVPWLMILAGVWRRDAARARHAALISLAGLVVTSGLILLPFVGSLHGLVEGVITMHTDAGRHYPHTIGLYAPLRSWLGLAALAGAIVAVARRDWRLAPLLGWLVAVWALLAELTPLFAPHLIALSAPLIALAVIGLASRPPRLLVIPAAGLIAIAMISAVRADRGYFHHDRLLAASPATRATRQVARLIDRVVPAGGVVVTDEPFSVDLANRAVPPWLVDPSVVRFVSGHLTTPQLIAAAQRPEVVAVLLYRRASIYHPFLVWASTHLHLVRSYGRLGALFLTH
jgi:Dolichyl-phosphate-mannose-protein mannosyltransferase